MNKELITVECFMETAVPTSAKGTIRKTSITDEELKNFNIGFKNTLTAECTTSSVSIEDFGIICNVPKSVEKTKHGDVLLLIFYARAKEKNTPVRAALLDSSGKILKNASGTNGDIAAHTYYIPTQWTKICLPVAVSEVISSVRLYMGQTESVVEFGGVSLEIADETKTLFELPQGYFLCEPYKRLIIDYSENKFLEKSTIKKCVDLKIHNGYIYAIGDETCWIISTETGKITGSVSGLGEVRQIAITEDAKTAVITSRVDGAFVIGIEDKTNPEIVGRCDTLEYATGIAIADNKAYITNRMFGTEIIDISDRSSPRNLSILRTGEAQSCEIAGTTLFAGCWWEKRVEAWDVSQPNNPIPINTKISVHGKGDGLCVAGNYMYVATGHEETDRASESVNNVGWGLGNGMDIYDISDLKNPIFLSTVRIDDHFRVTGNDYWSVKVAENCGKVYAYMTNTYNGVYIFDVTDPKAPIRLAVIELTVSKESNADKYNNLLNRYNHTNATSNRYYPYDTTLRHNSPVGGIATDNGKLYIGGISVGIAVVDSKDVGDILYPECRKFDDATPEDAIETFYSIDTVAFEKAGFSNIRHAQPGGQVYSVEYKDGLIYAACGVHGLKVLDTSLNTIREYPVRPDAIVSDVQINGNRLYTAEGLAGMAIYEISEDGLELSEISRYLSRNGSKIFSVKSVRVSPCGNYVLGDSGSHHSELCNFTNLGSPLRWKSENSNSDGWNPHRGLLYYRQLSSNLIGERYLCVYGYSGTVYWYDFGDRNTTYKPKLMYTVARSGLSMGGGFTALTGKNHGYALGLTNGKFFVFDPSKCDENTNYADLPHYSFEVSYEIDGKPTVYGNYMFVNNRYSGKCWIVDISGFDIKNNKYETKIIASFNFAGSPDLAKMCGESVVYPLGNQGILSFILPQSSNTERKRSK